MSQRQDRIKVELPSSSVITGAGELAKTAQTHMQSQRASTREEQQIGQKTRQGLAKQIGYAMKGAHAQHLVDIIDQRTIEGFADYVDFDRSIRNKPRDPRDQADVEYFCQLLKQAHATSLVVIRGEAVGQIERVISDSLDPEEEKQTHYIVEHTPGLFGSLFGGETWTKVLYDIPDQR